MIKKVFISKLLMQPIPPSSLIAGVWEEAYASPITPPSTSVSKMETAAEPGGVGVVRGGEGVQSTSDRGCAANDSRGRAGFPPANTVEMGMDRSSSA